LIIAPGQSSIEEMIRNTKRGVYVTRFHYTHCPEPMQVIATGTTRDGTFLIENGEIVARLKNLRYTDSMIRVFANVDSLSKQQYLVKDGGLRYHVGPGYEDS
jgi:predicted Zn-dependent protease